MIDLSLAFSLLSYLVWERGFAYFSDDKLLFYGLRFDRSCNAVDRCNFSNSYTLLESSSVLDEHISHTKTFFINEQYFLILFGLLLREWFSCTI